MTSFFRSAALVAAASLSFVPLHAQTQNVVYGRTTLTFNAAFQRAISGLATLTDLDGNTLPGGVLTLKVATGTVSLTTAQGEIIHDGGFVATGNDGTIVRVQNLILDSTSVVSPSISAMLVINGTYVGRQSLFGVLVPPTFAVPLVPVNGALQENSLTVYLLPTASAMLNKMFGNVTASGQSVGTANEYLVFSASPATDK